MPRNDERSLLKALGISQSPARKLAAQLALSPKVFQRFVYVPFGERTIAGVVELLVDSLDILSVR